MSAPVHDLPPVGFSGATVLVVGDLMLDRYVLGDVNRISPEAPVPVLNVTGRREVAGGAANVALNVAGLRAKAIVAGAIGKDAAGTRLMEILRENNVGVEGVITAPQRLTTSKTRVMCGNHQIVRYDEELTDDLDPAASEELFEGISEILETPKLTVVLSDYAKGLLTATLTIRLISACSDRGIPVLVDPKRADYSPYRHATCITPNLREFRSALAAMGIAGSDIASGGSALLCRLNCSALLVTQGANGMTLVTRSGAEHFPAIAEEVFDVSGAGDTVIGTLAAALAGGLDMVNAAQLSNAAASIVVRRSGTAAVDWRTLYQLART